MSGPTTTVTVKGGPYDSETFPMPINELEIGVKAGWRDTTCTMTQDSSGRWIYVTDGDDS